jgi:hypothetical protein
VSQHAFVLIPDMYTRFLSAQSRATFQTTGGFH